MRTNEYLALAYVQSRDLSNATPGELLVMYKAALEQVNRKEDQLFELGRQASEQSVAQQVQPYS